MWRHRFHANLDEIILPDLSSIVIDYIPIKHIDCNGRGIYVLEQKQDLWSEIDQYHSGEMYCNGSYKDGKRHGTWKETWSEYLDNDSDQIVEYVDGVEISRDYDTIQSCNLSTMARIS